MLFHVVQFSFKKVLGPNDIFKKRFLTLHNFSIFVLLSAHIDIFRVSRMRDLVFADILIHMQFYLYALFFHDFFLSVYMGLITRYKS